MRGSRIFSGGGGVQARWSENSLDHVPGGSNFFPGGGGVQMLISIETHINCDFPGGGGPDPLTPCTWSLVTYTLKKCLWGAT